MNGTTNYQGLQGYLLQLTAGARPILKRATFAGYQNSFGKRHLPHTRGRESSELRGEGCAPGSTAFGLTLGEVVGGLVVSSRVLRAGVGSVASPVGSYRRRTIGFTIRELDDRTGRRTSSRVRGRGVGPLGRGSLPELRPMMDASEESGSISVGRTPGGRSAALRGPRRRAVHVTVCGRRGHVGDAYRWRRQSRQVGRPSISIHHWVVGVLPMGRLGPNPRSRWRPGIARDSTLVGHLRPAQLVLRGMGRNDIGELPRGGSVGSDGFVDAQRHVDRGGVLHQSLHRLEVHSAAFTVRPFD
jgi:hypothetical protein